MKLLKVCLYLLFLASFAFSCTPTKRIKDPQVVTADDGRDKGVDVGDVKIDDTDKNDTQSNPKDLKEGADIGTNKSSYNIALFLPFSSNESDTRFMQYYGGLKLAAKKLEEEFINLKISVFDSNDKSSITSLNPSNLNLIFAPNDEAQLKQLLEVAKSNKIPVVSPFYSLSSVENNPFYIQLKPSLKSHYFAMMENASRQYKVSEIVLVLRDGKSDKNWSKLLQNSARTIFNLADEMPITEIVMDSLGNSKGKFSSMVNKGKKVFIIPNFSYKDENYINEIMKKISSEKGNKQVFVYGMNILKDSEIISSEFLRTLNIRIPTSKYADLDNQEIKNFGVKFFDSFGDIPDNNAYEGYDNLLYIGRCMYKYGTNFQYNLKEDKSYYLQTAFNIQPYKADNSSNEMDYFENNHVDILEFFNGKFIISR